MTRGNQRERDRAKAQKAAQGQKKSTGKSGSEMLRDKDKVAQIMREKQQKAEEKRKADAAAGGGGGGGDGETPK
ncbi:hypothetical protein BZA05DRAFT_408498 [Tricharina praecox]|uniref:uncharacterized protein n=1 Tax=Tricharina praecox TaxID=43433 RepID=UPI002220E97E|nr:uncharacterized protein BZA05DRAFT_408498 [Tricharina praecox]KAI5845432.1 hypothetical protein BZA05DRAFT_408498 [Tricharina praecox]